jgi:UPF0755 protein
VRNRRGRRWLVWIFTAILLAAAGAAAALLRNDWATPWGQYPPGGVFVEIPRGMTAAAIANALETQGVVRSALSFHLLALIHRHARLEAGEYHFDRPETPEEVFDTLAHGRIYTVAVIVPEGETMFDIAGQLEAKAITTRDAFLAAARSPQLISDFAPGAPSLEGFLFPATYHFPRHQPGQKIAEALVRRFREGWTGALAAAAAAHGDAPSGAAAKFTPLEIVVLASLVEKETAVPEERPLIASVFANRLRAGMSLDCDPTVIYSLMLAGRYNGQLLLADLRVDSPYNTYRRRGLPPGPIANPGAASLQAALAPAPTKYLYFVATGDGGHVFSRTLAEHTRNVARYRRREAQLARNHEPRGNAKQTP